jgi:hypothetical protein
VVGSEAKLAGFSAKIRRERITKEARRNKD